MGKYTYKDLTKEMRWEIAEQLAAERLGNINEKLEDVIVPDTFYVKHGKRFIDIIISLVAVIVSLPINLLIGVITYIDLGRPLFFVQERTGKDLKRIKIVKFRNMKIAYDERGEMLPPSERVTKWGRFVRKTSLDELLNFWSVLKGDMSIIGPRPLPSEYEIRYNKRHKARLTVRPGLECPPWVLKGNERTWQERLDNDVWYVEHISFKTDIIMCIRLMQYAFDKKNSTIRSEAGFKIFEGYTVDGVAMTVDQIPQEYIERIIEKHNIIK